MFRNMQFGLLYSVGSGDDVIGLSKTRREAVNVITNNFLDLCNEHSLLKPFSGPWFLALITKLTVSASAQLRTLAYVLGSSFC